MTTGYDDGRRSRHAIPSSYAGYNARMHLRVVCAVLAFGLAAAVGLQSPATGPDAVWSAQLHVHGSFSEGVGSIDSHSFEARQLGVDVIWWSDHDYRIATYRHVSTFGFNDWREPIDRKEPWAAWNERERGFQKSLLAYDDADMPRATARFVKNSPVEGSRCLRVRGIGDGRELTRRLYTFHANRAAHQRPLASGVVLQLSILPETIGENGTAVIEVGLSEHPSPDGAGFENSGVRYLLSTRPGERYMDGAVLCVPLECQPGEWNHYALPVTADAGPDNSLKYIAVGIQAREGAEVSACFDDLRIEQELHGAELYDKQRQLLEQVAQVHPDPVQLQGVEISYLGPHLNEFSVGTELVDIDAVVHSAGLARGEPVEVNTDELARAYVRRAVEAAHARGGLISLNHAFGARQAGEGRQASREEVLEQVLSRELHGADLIEVGYRYRGGHSLADHLWLWDRLAAAGHYPVGIGVSDSHGGADHRWRTAKNNFVSWIHAPAPTKPELLEGLRAGRVFFGDIVLFDGRVDILTDAGFRMGQIVLTDRDSYSFEAQLEGLEAGDQVHLVGARGRLASHELQLDASTGGFVRVEVYSAEGVAKVFSNAIHFVRRAPPGGIVGARAGLDVGGIRSERVRSFTLLDARATGAGEELVVEIRGVGKGGLLALDVSALGSARVELDGLTASVEQRGASLELRDIEGDGRIVLRKGP